MYFINYQYGFDSNRKYVLLWRKDSDEVTDTDIKNIQKTLRERNIIDIGKATIINEK